MLSASACCWGAALAGVRATPSLLGNRPSYHPVREASLAIERRRCSAHCGTSSARCARATFAVNSATPFFLANGPPSNPICKAIGAVVGISWSWRLGRETTDVVVGAAPRLLAGIPSGVLSDCAIVRINWPDRNGWLRHWLGDRLRDWSGRRRRWRSWRLSWEGSRWYGRRGLGQSCSRRGCGASPADRVAAENLLL